MVEKLKKLLNNAYSPYYKFPVAAIAIMNDGSEFCGVNVENANGTSICAERNAIANAVAHGYKKGDFKEWIMLGLKELLLLLRPKKRKELKMLQEITVCQ